MFQESPYNSEEDAGEIALIGGQMTPGVVRIGETVRRPMQPGAEFRHKLLQLLQESNFESAPKFLGIDNKNREKLSFFEGEVGQSGKLVSLETLTQVAGAVRKFHDITEHSELSDGQEVVCHNDLAPWNTVFGKDGELVGFIDFDAAAPGERLDDLGYMIWTFLNLGSNPDILYIQEGIAAIIQSYGLDTSHRLIDAILAQQQRVLDWRSRMATQAESLELRQFSVERAEQINQQIAWVEQNRSILEVASSNN